MIKEATLKNITVELAWTILVLRNGPRGAMIVVYLLTR